MACNPLPIKFSFQQG